MSASNLCELCCEQAAGSPPEFNWFGELSHYARCLCERALKLLAILGRIIGFACFFFVAIWFHPIGVLTAADERRIQQINERLRREEEDKQRLEAEARAERELDAEFRDRRIAALRAANNADVETVNAILGKTIYSDPQRRANDEYLLHSHNGLIDRLEKGVVDSEIAMLEQMRNLQEVKRNVLTESLNAEERQRLARMMRQLEGEMDQQIRHPDPDRHRQDRELDYLRNKWAEAQWNYDQLR